MKGSGGGGGGGSCIMATAILNFHCYYRHPSFTSITWNGNVHASVNFNYNHFVRYQTYIPFMYLFPKEKFGDQELYVKEAALAQDIRRQRDAVGK